MSASEDASGEPAAKEIKLKKFRLGHRRKERIFRCVINNDVYFLKKLLNSPILYRVTDNEGNNLLQTAIIWNSKEVFDYILSLDKFPLEHRNKSDETALIVAIKGFDTTRYIRHDEEYFAIELIEKGVQVYKSALDDAARRNFVKVAKLLLDKGFDLNWGSALSVCLCHFRFDCELAALLLTYGADPSSENIPFPCFELVIKNPGAFDLYESMFFYTVDDFTCLKMHLSTLIHLVKYEYPFFDTVINHLTEVTVDLTGVENIHTLFEGGGYNGRLEVFIEKCYLIIIYVILVRDWVYDYDLWLVPFTVNLESSIEDLFLFIEDNLEEDIVDFVADLSSNAIFRSFTVANLKESTLIPLICCLLSYGLKLNELDLQFVYEKYGYCELFKILLHMDFKLGIDISDGFRNMLVQKGVLPMFICDINLDLPTCLGNLSKYLDVKHVDQLLNYFADDDLKGLCNAFPFNEKFKLKVKKLPQIPLLLQLARDAFRKKFIDKYKIKTCSQFYTYMNHFPINDVYKKIITFEKKIY